MTMQNKAMKQLRNIDKNKIVILEHYEGGEKIDVTDRQRKDLQELADLMEALAGHWDRRGSNR